MAWKDFVGKRVLVRIRDSFNKYDIQEMYVVEVSPTGRYVKLSTEDSAALGEWFDTDEITLLEVLDQ